MSEPDHFYVATWKEIDIASVIDLEPIYEPQYIFKSGPYAEVDEAWESAWLDDEEWNAAVVIGFKGCNAVAVYYDQMDNTPYEGDDFRPDIAREALFEKISN